MRPYEAVEQDLRALARSKARVMVDPARCSWAVSEILREAQEAPPPPPYPLALIGHAASFTPY